MAINTTISRIISTLIMVCLVSTLSGCLRPADLEQFIADTKRKIKPRFLRTQIYRNTPTAYNQTADPRTMDPKSRHFASRGEPRIKENLHYAGKIREDSYGRGWQDGCHTFTGIMGAGPYRLLKPIFKTNKLTKDPWYLRGFQDGSTFCTFRIDWEVH